MSKCIKTISCICWVHNYLVKVWIINRTYLVVSHGSLTNLRYTV